jgi:hypothetical protein
MIEDTMTENDFFSVQELEVPPSAPDAHRATIVSVEGITSKEKRTPGVKISFVSRDVPTLETNKVIWLPKQYVEQLGSKSFDPRTLDEKAQVSFRMSVANSDKTAELQTLVFNPNSVARSAGQDPQELELTQPVDFDSYVANISAMLVGVECIITRRERGGDDPAFKHNLEVKKIFPADAYETNPKAFKNYQRAWEQ